MATVAKGGGGGGEDKEGEDARITVLQCPGTKPR